ncbi:MAG: hypothetical protein GY757_22890 [bacterium]|nr:hypothetical protein [bacterium]
MEAESFGQKLTAPPKKKLLDSPLYVPFERMRAFQKEKQYDSLRNIAPYNNIFCIPGEEQEAITQILQKLPKTGK